MEEKTIEELERELRESEQVVERNRRRLDDALEARKQKALCDIAAAMEEAEVTLEDLVKSFGRQLQPPTDVQRRPDGTIMYPRYRNPENHSETWNGRGGEAAIPEWIKPYRLPGEGARRFKIEAWHPFASGWSSEKKRQDREAEDRRREERVAAEAKAA